MRSRYAAYAVGDLDYVFRTWHPRTRPANLSPTPGLTWTGLEVLAVGDADDVEFIAHFTTTEGTGELHEHSRFEKRAGRWFYVDAVD